VSAADFCGGGVQAGRSSTSLMVADICLGLAAFVAPSRMVAVATVGRSRVLIAATAALVIPSDEPAVRSSAQPGASGLAAAHGGADRLAACHHRQDAGVGRRRVNRSDRGDRCRDSYHQIKTDDVFRYTQGPRIDP
jgi:hypothetical protein